jgi:hypothetical protein
MADEIAGWPARWRRAAAALLASVCVLLPLEALAHKGSDAYLAVASDAQGRAELRLSIALKDLDVVLPVDGNQDGQVTWGEVRAAAPAVDDHLAQGMSWTRQPASSEADCAPAWTLAGLERRGDGTYWVAQAVLPCDAPALQLDYRLMQEVDRSHRLLVSGAWRGQALLATLAPGDTLKLGNAQTGSTDQGRLATVLNYLQTGALHLLEGYDHLAFLLALVLPLYLPLRHPFPGVHVRPVAISRSGRPSDWGRMLTTITAFTLGHSVTLGLVAWGWLQVSSDWVEPAIVISIGVSALLNIYPVGWMRTEVLAGLFGLVHGMGFAGLLLDAQAPLSLLPWALLGFNLGIEAAQLLVLCGWVLICQPMLSAPWYPSRVVRGLSWALVALSLVLLPRFAGWY